MKRDVSRIAAAAASVVFGFVGGLLGLRTTEALISLLPIGNVPVRGSESESKLVIVKPSLDVDPGIVFQGAPVVGEIEISPAKPGRRSSRHLR